MKDNLINMTTAEQLALMEFIAVHGAYGVLAQGDFVSPEDTQKAIRLASNARILSAVLEDSKDVVSFKDLRDSLTNSSDALVTRWKHLLPQATLEELEKLDDDFRAFAKSELIANGLDEEEAERSVQKIIPFNVLNGGK